MGLLTKIFGNPEGGASTSNEPQATESVSGSAAADARDPVISAYPRSDGSSSGIRPAVEAAPARSREPGRAPAGPRRPEHPRMYLRPTPATVDPSVPGSTRRQQISVRPGVSRDTTRGNPPPPKRSLEHDRSDRQSSARVPERTLRRDRPSEPIAAATPQPRASRPPGSRPRMVVSPVSLTQEEVQPGARPKMPTLLGLGAAMDSPPLHDGFPPHPRPDPGALPSDPATASRSAPGSGSAERPGADAPPSSSGQRPAVRRSGSSSATWERADRYDIERGGSAADEISSGFHALARDASAEALHDVGASAQLIADFALKLALGPISMAWIPDVRRSVDALLLTGKHRNETALVALSTRLLEVLPSATPAPRDGTTEALSPRPAHEDASLEAAPEGDAPIQPNGAAARLNSAAAQPNSTAEASAPEANAVSEGESFVGAAVANAAGHDAAVVDAAVVDAAVVDAAGAGAAVAEVSAVEMPVGDAAVESRGGGAGPDATGAAPAATESAADSSSEAASASGSSEPVATQALVADTGAASPSPAAPPGDGPRANELAADAPTVSSEAPSAVESPAPTVAAAFDGDTASGLEGALRERILHEVSRLAGVLPEWPAPAQDLLEEARRREVQVMRELLTRVDGLRRDQRARLEEQVRLEELARMPPDAIAAEFDAPLERAGELRRVLDDYRNERLERAPDVGNSLGLRRALDELDRQCQAFDDCDPEQKEAVRSLRAHRRSALSAVNLLLAERGELEWLEQLEPMAISERVERLKQWLDAGSERTCRT